MIKITNLLACFFVCICLSGTAWGWGQEGHMVVAQIAYNHLSPAVKAQCDALIAVPLSFANTKSTNFVTASSWADDFKSQLGTGTSHYIDLPLCISGYLGTNCLDGTSTNTAPPAVPNVVTAINQYIAVLLNPNAALTNRATALRYVIHFVGDIQQPLHSSNGISTGHPPPGGDGGGNGFSLKGTFNELHALWDDGGGYLNDPGVNRPLSTNGVATITNKAADVEATYPYTPNIGSIPDHMTWAQEGWGLAQTVAYVGITEGGTPTASYLNTAMSTSKQRMAAGGKRLADLLMTIFATNAASFTASPTSGSAPLNVTFTDTSTGSITNWFWNFGDGQTTNFTASANPSHSYTAGTYTVTLIVSGYPGSSTNTKSSYITASGCTPPTASVSGGQSICQGGSATIQAALTGTGPWNVTWLDGAGGTNYTQNGVAVSSAARTVSPSSTTTYTVTAVSDTSGCSGGTSSGSAIVTVNAIPATPTASNNSPICSGGTLTLSTPTVTGATYSWTGPNGFASAQQNPSITNATTTASGPYSVTIIDSNGCPSAARSTTATVNPTPAAPTAGNNGPILVGNTLNLTASTVTGGTYNWTGPNGFASTDQNPSIPNTTSVASGTYGVTVTDTNGCMSAAGSTTALVATPQITSITRQDSDILITWETIGGTTNTVQATPGNPDNTNFVDISAPLVVLGSGGSSTNYVDSGAATNSPVKFYRVRLVP